MESTSVIMTPTLYYKTASIQWKILDLCMGRVLEQHSGEKGYVYVVSRG